MKNNKTKVESKALNIINSIVDKNARLLPDINFGDRGISTDGYIQLFKSEKVDKGENLLRQIPIQVKGRTDKSKKLVRINASQNKETVDLKDIQNYYRQGGVIFFYVYFDKNYEEHAVFYSVFLPVKCKRYMDIAFKSKLNKVPVSFEKMDETGDAIYELCAQFYEEQNKQGFGGGIIMEHIVSWKDIKGETTLTTSAVGAKSPLEILRRVVRGDIYLYAKNGAFTVPVEWIEGGRILQFFTYEYPVIINEETYYDHVDVEVDTETNTQRLRLGKAIIIDIDKGIFTFEKDAKSFYDLAEASRFLLALSKYKSFTAGEISLKLSRFNINESNEELEIHIEINRIIETIGLDSKKIINIEENELQRRQIFQLWEIANHRKDQYLKNLYTHFDWSLGDKKYPLVIVRNEGNIKNDLYSFLYTSKYQTFCVGEDGGHYPVPTFAFPSYDVMHNLYSYDITAFEEQIRRIQINETTKEYVNIGTLKLLSIYDVYKDEKILALVYKLFENLSSLEMTNYSVIINKLQVKKRMNSIGDQEIEELIKISKCGQKIFEFAANVILGNVVIATQDYKELTNDEKEELKDTPLMTLYQALVK